jgi:hypothetical protein
MSDTKTAPSKPEPGPKPEFIVIEDHLHYRTKAGDEIVLNLDIPFGGLMDAAETEGSDQAQFMAILDVLGDQTIIDRVRALGSIEALKLIARFFEEFNKLVGASVGESQA